MSRLGRHLTFRVNNAISRLRRGLAMRHEVEAGRRDAFRQSLRRQIDRVRAARLMREEFRALRRSA